MRQFFAIAICSLAWNAAIASCPADACYAVTFKVLSCTAQPSEVAAPSLAKSPEGVVLKAESVLARPVQCALGAEHWKASGTPEIQNERAFFYRASVDEKSACSNLAGKTVTLFAPARCCDTPNSCTPMPARELLPLPLSAQ